MYGTNSKRFFLLLYIAELTYVPNAVQIRN